MALFNVEKGANEAGEHLVHSFTCISLLGWGDFSVG